MHDQIIEALRQALSGCQDVRLALLFGSRARGRSRPESDADVAILGKNLDLLALAAERTRALLQAETDRPGYERMRDGYLRKLAAGRHG